MGVRTWAPAAKFMRSALALQREKPLHSGWQELTPVLEPPSTPC